MITVKKTNCDELDKKTMYKLTHADGVNVKDCENGDVVKVYKFALYDETKPDKNGNEKTDTVLSILDENMVKYHTISPYFIDSFMEILEIFGEDLPGIAICKKVSKGGRTFVSATIE